MSEILANIRLCVICMTDKPVQAFYGRRTQCRACVIGHHRFLNAWSPRHKATTAWQAIKLRLGLGGPYAGVELRADRESFLKWATEAFAEWISRPDYDPDDRRKRASVDRIDNFGHYEIGNMQLLTTSDNAKKRRNIRNLEAPEGQIWCWKCESYRPIDHFGENKSRHTGRSDVCMVCRNKNGVRPFPKKQNEIAPEGMRWCQLGQHYRPEVEFLLLKGKPHGSCKTCTNKRNRDRRKALREQSVSIADRHRTAAA